MDARIPEDTPPVEWLTIKAAAHRVGRSTKTIRRAVKDGRLVAQRATDSDVSAWLVSSESVAEEFGPPVEPAERVTDDPTTVRSLVRQVDAIIGLLNDAERGRREALERAIRAETINEHLVQRLRETSKPEAEPEPEPTRRKRRWWQA